MSTLTITLPDETVRLAAEKAERAHLTLAEWVGLRIAGRSRVRPVEGRDEMGYPRGWFERTTGALADVEDLIEPADRPEPPIAPLEP